MSATSTKQNDKSKQAAATEKGPREGSVMWAVVQVLDGKREPMNPAKILAEIQKRKLAKKLKGKTPEASVAARLAVHAAKGLYVERPEKGKYRLKKGVTAKSASSGSGSKPAAKGGGAKSTSKRASAKPTSQASGPAGATTVASASAPQQPEPESAQAPTTA